MICVLHGIVNSWVQKCFCGKRHDLRGDDNLRLPGTQKNSFQMLLPLIWETHRVPRTKKSPRARASLRTPRRSHVVPTSFPRRSHVDRQGWIRHSAAFAATPSSGLSGRVDRVARGECQTMPHSVVPLSCFMIFMRQVREGSRSRSFLRENSKHQTPMEAPLGPSGTLPGSFQAPSRLRRVHVSSFGRWSKRRVQCPATATPPPTERRPRS